MAMSLLSVECNCSKALAPSGGEGLGEGNKNKVLYSLFFNLFKQNRSFEEENYLTPSLSPLGARA